RVREARVVVDVRQPRQRDGEARADQLAQARGVALRLPELALVVALGVDHQAVGAVVDGVGADLRLAQRIAPVYVLPGAHAQAVCVQRRDERAVELRPRVRA